MVNERYQCPSVVWGSKEVTNANGRRGSWRHGAGMGTIYVVPLGSSSRTCTARVLVGALVIPGNQANLRLEPKRPDVPGQGQSSVTSLLGASARSPLAPAGLLPRFAEMPAGMPRTREGGGACERAGRGAFSRADGCSLPTLAVTSLPWLLEPRVEPDRMPSSSCLVAVVLAGNPADAEAHWQWWTWSRLKRD
jgi:hypothetical protein